MDETFRGAARRLDLALALKDEGDLAGAREAADAACVLQPDWVDAWFVVAETCEQLGTLDDAISAYHRCLAIDPADRFGAAARLAMMGAAPTPTRLPAAYVTALFDGVATRFEESLVGRLDYRAPQLLYDAVTDHRDRLATPLSILDLGCGTGLAGEIFRKLAQRLDGIDLSPRMIDEATRKNVYDSARSGDLLEKPGAADPRYGLVIAADVFNYLGDLKPAFVVAASRLIAGGMLAFTIEEGAIDPFDLGPGQRYRHYPAAVRADLNASGFQLLDDREADLRLERREPVRGRILLAIHEPRIHLT